MLKLNFAGDGELLGETRELKFRGPRGKGKVLKSPKRSPDRYCATCLRVRVYGVSTCLPCLKRMGTAVAATVLVYPHSTGYRVQVTNLKKIVTEIRKYGVEPPARWAEIADSGRKLRSTEASRDARARVGSSAVFVRDGRKRVLPAE